MIRSSLALAFALVGVLPVFGGDQPTIFTGSDEFEFVYRVKLPSIDGKARLWMPLARTDAFQSPRTKARAQSKATIAGPNSSPADAGSRSISAKHGKIRRWPTIISVII